MNLLDLMVKIGVEDNATSGVGKIASKVTSALGTAAKAATAAVTAAAGGIGAVTKASLDAYAAYEQNVGGVQKLFGNMGKGLEEYAEMTGQSVDQVADKWQSLENAQNTVLSNAKQAWKTAGMSANQYMEQVTSFSAALITSMNNDTEAAAARADMAMVDMSDNVNTLGSNMEDVQNAYQGFAKQNYTMLDNLKLGYGGTQEEMKRLVKDAHAVNDAVDESSLSFDNIVLAIHTMQEQMQIAGTTSREAATTIEGSVNSMKAAWQNWLTGLGDSDADVQQLTEELVESFEVAAENVVPRVSIILGTLLGEVPELAAKLGPAAAQAVGDTFATAWATLHDMLPEDVQETLNQVEDKVGSALGRVKGSFERVYAAIRWSDSPFDALMNGSRAALTEVESALGGLVGKVSEKLPEMAERAGELGEALSQGIAENTPEVIENGLDMLAQLSGSLREGAGQLIDSGASMLENLAQGIADSMPSLIERGPEIVSNLAGIINDNVPRILECAFNIIVTLGAGLIQSIPTLVANIPQIIQAVVDAFLAFGWVGLGGKAVKGMADGIKGMVGNARSAGAEVLSNVENAIVSLPGRLLNLGRNAVSDFSGSIASGAGSAFGSAWKIAENVINAITSLPSRMVEIGRNIIQGLINGIRSQAGGVISAITGVASGAIDWAKNILGINSPSKVFKQFGEYVDEGFALGIDGAADGPAAAMSRVVDGIEGASAFDVSGGYAARRSSGGSAALLQQCVTLLGQLVEKDDGVYMDGAGVSSALAQRARTTMRGRGYAV